MTEARVLAVGVADEPVTTLSDADFAVDRAGSIDAAVDAAGQYGCVVAGIELSDGSGFDLAARLGDRSRPVPVVVVGSASHGTVAAEALEADVAAYVNWTEAESAGRLPPTVSQTVETVRGRRDSARVPRDTPDPVCLVRNGRVVEADARVESLLGVESVEGRKLAAVASSTDAEAVQSILDDADEPTTIVFHPAADPSRTLELCIRRSNVDDAVVATIADVTDRASERSELETAGGMLDTLFEHVPMSIYFKDHLGRHERVSEHATKTNPQNYIKNYEGKIHPHPADLVGKTDHDLYAPEFAEETYADDLRVLSTEDPVVDRTESGLTNSGELLHMSTTKVPRYDEAGNVVGLVGVTVDVTERVTHREELERQNERLNEFAEVLTHDLRNPLNIANGYLDVLEEGYGEGAVDEIANALGRMGSLIEEIRSYVLEGRLVEEPKAVDLQEVAEEAWSTVETADATLESGGELHLRADRTRFRRLLENLFRNAIEHGMPGRDANDTVPLSVHVVGGDHQFAVEDDGTGVSPESITDLFERGYSTSEDGTGFGLAIVESIAEAHGWSISVEESEDGGTRFVFSDVVHAEAESGTTTS